MRGNADVFERYIQDKKKTEKELELGKNGSKHYFLKQQ